MTVNVKLMSRITIPSFLTLPYEEQLHSVMALQTLRANTLAESRIKKGRETKSATKNKAKRGKKVQNLPGALTKLLKAMTPSERLAFLSKV